MVHHKEPPCPDQAMGKHADVRSNLDGQILVVLKSLEHLSAFTDFDHATYVEKGRVIGHSERLLSVMVCSSRKDLKAGSAVCGLVVRAPE